jgi:F0F1-type ATP synthase delta subunit
MAPKDAQITMVLPVSVIGRVDIGRLQREVEALLNFIQQSAIRQPGTQPKLPKTSRLLDEIIQANKINVLLEDDCKKLLKFLQDAYKHAPVMHISFGADPSPLFTQKLVTWLRTEIHPQILLQIGLQPNIGAGCIVRTTNKYFDFSLRQRFTEKRALLSQALKEAKA